VAAGEGSGGEVRYDGGGRGGNWHANQSRGTVATAGPVVNRRSGNRAPHEAKAIGLWEVECESGATAAGAC
jgi:hypothetical protein